MVTSQDWPDLSTFFEAEILGDKHAFLTRKWEADETIDKQHWVRVLFFVLSCAMYGSLFLSPQQSKFPAFKDYETHLNDDTYIYDWSSSDFIFMRWKEHFLVPDHRIRTISGASFAGFYYIVFQKSTGLISGLYYHSNSEWFQHLSLHHVPSTSFSGESFMFFTSFR